VIMRRRATVGSGRGLTPAAALRCWLGVLAGFGGVGVGVRVAAVSAGLGGCSDDCGFCADPWVSTTLAWTPMGDRATTTDSLSTDWAGEIFDEAGNASEFFIRCPDDVAVDGIATSTATMSLACQYIELGSEISFSGATLTRIRGTFFASDVAKGTFDFVPQYEPECQCRWARWDALVPRQLGPVDAVPD
jgi:hypothetical protein